MVLSEDALPVVMTFLVSNLENETFLAYIIFCSVLCLDLVTCRISDPDLGFVAIAANANIQFNNSFIHSPTRIYDWTD